MTPASSAHGRVPCDLYPAFSEPVCRPSGPTDAEIRARVAGQLVPTGGPAHIGALLACGAYTFIFRPPISGTLTITWRPAPGGRKVDPTVLARGRAESLNGRPRRVNISLTTAGRRAFANAWSLRVTASATFIPILHREVKAARTFTLRR